MKTKKQVVLRLMAIASLIVMMLAFAGPVGAVPVITELRCGQAVVDGNSSEWSVPANFDDWGTSPDFVAYMYRGFDSTKPVEAAVFVRYDLPTQTAYLLVLAKPGVPGIKSDADAWVSISDSSGKITPKVVTGSSVDDGVPPDFAWVGVGYDGDPNHVRGYEASFSLAPTTSTYLGAHLQVYDDVLSQTSGLNGKTVEIKTGCLLGSIGDYVWHDIESSRRPGRASERRLGRRGRAALAAEQRLPRLPGHRNNRCQRLLPVQDQSELPAQSTWWTATRAMCPSAGH